MKASQRFPTRRQHWGLIVILAIYLVLASYYSVATPILEASDEIHHYPFVKLIADGKGLPIQKPRAEDNLAKQEGSQPPLYYALAAVATFWINTGDFDSLIWANPHSTIGVPLAHGNKNMTIHTSREDFPYQGPALAVHIIRWLSLLMGAATITCVYLIVRGVLPSRPEVALGAAALVAFTPQFDFISASVNNDNLMTLLASIIILMLVSYVKKGITYRQSLILGVALGLALLTKLTSLGLIPVVLASVALICLRQRSLAQLLAHTVILTLVSVLMAGWWYVRNWLLYGEPTGLTMMLRIAGTRQTVPSLVDLLAEFQGFRISFWGLFGAVNVIADNWIYVLLDGAAVLAGAGLIFAGALHCISWISLAQAKYKTPVYDSVWKSVRGFLSTVLGDRANPVPSSILVLIPTVWLLINFGLLIRWTQATLASQGRLIFPAISGVFLLLALGWSALVPRRISWLPPAVVVVFLLSFSALAPSRYIVPAYAGPTKLTVADVPSDLRLANASFDGKMRLIGYYLDRQRIRPGDQISLTLYWQALAKMETDYSIFIHFRGRDNQAVAQEDTYPGLGAYPTRLLKAGDVFAEEHRLTISQAAETPALVRFAVGMYTLSTMQRLAAYDDNGTPLGDAPLLAELKLASVAPHLEPAHAVEDASFGNVVELIGYDLDRTTARPGDDLELTLYWRARQRPGDDYTVFTQLLGQQQRILGQHDKQPVDGNYPTRLWDAGEVVADRHVIRVREGSPPGKYSLIAGMYALATNQRLKLPSSGGQDYYTISEIVVIAPN